MSEMTMQVQERTALGKGPNRRLRSGGKIPAVVYGGGKRPVPIEVDRRELRDLLRQSSSENAVFLLKLGDTGKSRHTMIREIQMDPVSRKIVHVDFQRVSMSEKVRVMVAIQLQGTPSGVKDEGGVLDFVTREVEVECLPSDIPPHLGVDVSALEIGEHVEASDLQVPETVTLLEDEERVIASVGHPRILEVEEEEEELLEAELEEPEVIGRGKEEEEEEGEEEGESSEG
jgi:large subunit ribosomal protein L25